MKRIFNIFIIAATAVSVSSCKKYLDVNQNPNSPTTASPELVLPQSIVAVGANTYNYNFYGSQTVGYLANGGGVSGWGSIISYNYATTDQNNMWNVTYNSEGADLENVISSTEGIASYVQFNAAAKVMKAYAFQRLVDQYNDVPYSDALKGTANVTPKYDKAADIYKALADLCDNAIASFNANPAASALFKSSDPLFGSSANTTTEINRWIQLANTIKLRLVIRAGDKVAFTNKNFDAKGFLTDDAVINPGYARVSGKQNPFWNSFTYTFANAAVAVGGQYTPTPYVMGFFNGTKLTDPTRGNLYYKLGTSTPTNQLGNQLSSAGRGQVPNSWFKGTNATTYDQAGIFKGPDAGQPLFLAADSYFLQAEAALKGLISGTPQTLFNQGVQASFTYLDKNAAGVVSGNIPGGTTPRNPATEFAAYQTANAGNYLVNYALAGTDAQRLEAIITQKYIALNMIFGDEAWNEYRRTGYPANNTAANATASSTFISVVSESTAPDKLPTRILYPSSEFVYNAANVPSANQYTSKIFWAR